MKLEWSTKFGDLNVVLCRMPAVLWDLIIRFARDHDYDAGKSEWHIFDANYDGLKIYTPEARGNLNPGHHLFLHAVADVNRYSWRNLGGNVDIVWGVPSQYMVGPVDDQNYWSASTALEWLQDRLMPALKTWMWSRRSKFNRFKLRVKRQGPNNELRPNLILDYRKSNSISLPEKPDRKLLEDLSGKLQSAYASSEIEDHVEVPHESYSAVVDSTIRVLRYANPGDGPLSYMGGNNGIQAAGYEAFLSALAEQSKTLQRPDSPRRPIEMYLRSLLDALGHLKQELSPFDAEEILEALEPLVTQSNEFKFVRRHWAVNE